MVTYTKPQQAQRNSVRMTVYTNAVKPSGNGGIDRTCECEKSEIDIVEYDQVHIFSGWLQAYNFV